MHKMSTSFIGKRALVTGAGRGIGRDIASALSRCGAEVYALSRTQESLDTLKIECPSIHTVQCDLSNWDDTRAKVEYIGHIDLLVNNAAVAIMKPFMEFTSEDFDIIMNVNLKSVVNVSQIVAKKMIASSVEGVIVNVSSQSGLRGTAGRALYGASKAGLDQITRVMAAELGPHKIRVNSVNPTIVMTDMGRESWYTPERAEALSTLLTRMPLGKPAEMKDITEPVLFLLSEQAAMIQGAAIPIDGGYTAV